MQNLKITHLSDWKGRKSETCSVRETTPSHVFVGAFVQLKEFYLFPDHRPKRAGRPLQYVCVYPGQKPVRQTSRPVIEWRAGGFCNQLVVMGHVSVMFRTTAL